MKRQKKLTLLPYEILRSASHGDYEAMAQVLLFYDPYIKRLALQPHIDDDGVMCYAVNEDIRCRLEAKLMAKVLLFQAE